MSWLDISNVLGLSHSSCVVLSHCNRLVAIVVRAEGVDKTVGSAFKTSSEAVVFTSIVVVTHSASWFSFDLDFSNCILLDDNLVSVVSNWSATFVLYVVAWLKSAAVFALGNVDLAFVRALTDDFGVSLVIVLSLTARIGNVKVDSRALLIIRGSVLVSLARDVYFCNSLGCCVSVNVVKSLGSGVSLNFCILLLLLSIDIGLISRVLAFFKAVWILSFSDAGSLLVNYTEVVGWLFFCTRSVAVAFAVGDSDVDGFFLTDASIFPSDALGGTLLVDFPFYLCLCGSFYGSSVTPVRRREDTDWYGDAGVEVQVANFAVVLSSRLS